MGIAETRVYAELGINTLCDHAGRPMNIEQDETTWHNKGLGINTHLDCTRKWGFVVPINTQYVKAPFSQMPFIIG